MIAPYWVVTNGSLYAEYNQALRAWGEICTWSKFATGIDREAEANEIAALYTQTFPTWEPFFPKLILEPIKHPWFRYTADEAAIDAAPEPAA